MRIDVYASQWHYLDHLEYKKGTVEMRLFDDGSVTIDCPVGDATRLQVAKVVTDIITTAAEVARVQD